MVWVAYKQFILQTAGASIMVWELRNSSFSRLLGLLSWFGSLETVHSPDCWGFYHGLVAYKQFILQTAGASIMVWLLINSSFSRLLGLLSWLVLRNSSTFSRLLGLLSWFGCLETVHSPDCWGFYHGLWLLRNSSFSRLLGLLSWFGCL